MASTKELRIRIKSIRNTSKVTKAMELVSAAKMRRAQDQALRGRSYSELINKVLTSIASKINPEIHPLLLRENDGKEAIILISTSRGLCGSLNTNLFREAIGIEGDVSFFTIGKKGATYISKNGKALEADFEQLEKPTIAQAHNIAQMVIKGFLTGEFDKVHAVFTHFESTLKQTAVVRQLLPIINKELLDSIVENESNKFDEYLFEPNADQVLEAILPHYIEMEIYQIMLESSASEHSARMVAMKNASDNAVELVDDLTLVYNGLRQAVITNEILDITTAALALE